MLSPPRRSVSCLFIYFFSTCVHTLRPKGRVSASTTISCNKYLGGWLHSLDCFLYPDSELHSFMIHSRW